MFLLTLSPPQYHRDVKNIFFIVSRSFFIIINSVKVDDKKNLQAVYLLHQL